MTIASVSAHFGLPWLPHWGNRGKSTWMERGFNACQTHRSIVPIHLRPFPSNSTRPYVQQFAILAHCLQNLASLGTPMGQSRLMLHEWKED